MLVTHDIGHRIAERHSRSDVLLGFGSVFATVRRSSYQTREVLAAALMRIDNYSDLDELTMSGFSRDLTRVGVSRIV